MKNLTEAELVELAKKGNERAFSYLFDSIRGGVTTSMCFKFSNISKEQVEDAVQEAFIKAFVNIKKFKTEYKFSSWVKMICRNAIVDQMRKTYHKINSISLDLTVSDDDNSQSLHTKITDGLNNPEEAFMKEQRKEFVHKIINDDSINENSKAVAKLFYIKEMKLTKIADELNLSLNTVTTSKRRFDMKAASNMEFKRELAKY